MLIISLLLLVISGIAKAAMDKHQFHYSQSVFYQWAKAGGVWGRFWRYWSGPKSWQNKYFVEGPAWWQWLCRTAFVAFTDAWHAFQWLHLNAKRLIIILLFSQVVNWPTWAYAGLWGGIAAWEGGWFELFFTYILHTHEKGH